VRRGLGMAARHRIELLFSLPAIVERYQAIYEELAAGAGQPAASATVSAGA